MISENNCQFRCTHPQASTALRTALPRPLEARGVVDCVQLAPRKTENEQRILEHALVPDSITATPT